MTTTDKLTKTFSRNLNHYMALLGLSQTDLINALKEYGIKVNQASVSYWLSGKKTPRADKWDALCGILNISRSDLVSTNYFQTDNKVNASRIPVYGKVAAGIPIEAIEDIIDYEEIPEQMAKSGEYFGLKIQGNSMEPKIGDSDIVIVRRQEDADNGDVVIAMIDGNDAVCKRLRKYADGGLELISSNPSYAPIEFSLETAKDVKILGKVVELRSKF